MDAALNPLLSDWSAPHALPAFDAVRPESFRPAFEAAMREHRAELAAIVADPRRSFESVIAAFDCAGEGLARIEALFYNLTASATTPALQAVQREMAAPLAAHWNAVRQDAALFRCIDDVWQRRDDLGLDAEQRRLVERIHQDFVRAGARLEGAQRERYAEVVQRLAELTTVFGQNVLHDESDYMLELQDEAAAKGLPRFVRSAATQAAADRGLAGRMVITLSRSLVLSFLTFSQHRELREQVWRAWVGRGERTGEHDNRPIAREILALRREQAALLGHACYADHALADTMALTRERVWALLDEVWQRAVPAWEQERELLLEAMRAAGVDHPLQPWDWRYWAEQVRQSRYALDESELKPYFSLDAMVRALFECAHRLFDLRFEHRPDLRAYHPDVKAYEVSGHDGEVIGLFLHDNFSRPGKRSGAWMSALRWQHRNAAGGGRSQPIILNNNNFAKAPPGETTLLSLDDVRTLFHEFGHGLHGLLSDVGYNRLSGTKVLRDFVELPSQLFEHWAQEREVLRRHARHHATGEPLPQHLIERIEAARRFGQGYETVRYTASAIVDMAVHECPEPVDDIVAFEADVLARRGAPPAAGLNHRLVHFQHLFSGSAYAAGYYVYLWAEVLDADAYQAFVEAGDPFDAPTARRLLQHIYSRGDSVEPGATYRSFRGREATLEPMLRDRGLIN
jgi:peptidyl-dipeptidase Dcp